MPCALVVEDNQLNMQLFHVLLGANGFDVLQAFTGEDGYRLAMDSRPDVIVMDIHLPGACGLEVSRWIRAGQQVRHVPIVAVTSLAWERAEQATRDAGCDAFFVKPVAIQAFLETVRRLTAGST